ncbi:TonB-dependent receptor [Aliifodinibius sp. S!AR15-10]|uniref:TonB-dependent receptor n=1 Tax=Aliifodinibius sp. S!AR15-10 TaxID=2950437 RepID=UPI0028543F63|nr:TonB-dependent receptor [Aliifodinibius sp. S!AR15-10]MDR8392883.1 TonB-dependent receptor [Aliifodinibius sp. S!AR15-10]
MFRFISSLSGTILFLFLITSTALSQTISGTVRDAQTDKPLAGANIVQVGTQNGTSADENGIFRLQLSADGSRALTVSFIGYKTKTVEIDQVGEDLEISLVPQSFMSNEVFVRALRVDEASPMAYENLEREEIEKKNLGQDIPSLVGSTPSVTTTSDAGAGIGYSGVRIRGVDPTSINVTINGIPLNDAESHGVFWVDLPDLASSVENIQIQRGVGTSTHGAGAFGATMNIQTSVMSAQPYGEVNTGVGSFNTRKYNVQLGSGLMENGWQFEGRLSKIASDGYIDRASSDLKSFYLSGSKSTGRSLLKVDILSGVEETYQAWNGVPKPILEGNAQGVEDYINGLFVGSEQAEHMRENVGNRQYNEFTYDDQTDNYQQDHYQAHYSYQLTDRWNLNTSLHYTYGRGYYEEFRNNDDLSVYGIGPIEIGNTTITNSDLVRRRWLNNHFYGLVFSSEYRVQDEWSVTVGGGYNEYDGDHYGEVIWARYAGDSSIEETYYDNNGFKTDFNVYAKSQYFFTDAISGYLDLQLRGISYKFLGKDTRTISGTQQIIDVRQSDRLSFFNPKAGLVYRLDERQRVYASFSVANREPTRDEYVDSTPQSRPSHESLYDWEFGYRGSFSWFFGAVNLYYMDYKDQLVQTGEINDVGAHIRQNVSDSYRAGVELQAGVELTPGFEWSGNATFSRNRIEDYTYYLDNFDQGGQEATTFESTSLSFSPSFIGNSIFSYTEGSLTAELISKYVSRQYLDNTENRSRSIDPYFVNDIRLGYNFTQIPYVKGLQATLQVNNVLDEEYETNGYTFGWVGGGEQQHYSYYYPQAGRNFLLQLSFKF